MGLSLYCYLYLTTLTYVLAHPAANVLPSWTFSFSPIKSSNLQSVGQAAYSGMNTLHKTASNLPHDGRFSTQSSGPNSGLNSPISIPSTPIARSTGLFNATPSAISPQPSEFSNAHSITTKPPGTFPSSQIIASNSISSTPVPSAAAVFESIAHTRKDNDATPTSVPSAAASSIPSSDLDEFNTAPSTTTLTVSGTPIIFQKDTLPGFADLTGIRTITTSVPTATASGIVAYANGPIVVGPQGAVWGVSTGDENDGSQGNAGGGDNNQGSSPGTGFLGMIGIGGQGLGKEGLGGGPGGAIGDAAHDTAGGAGAVDSAGEGLGGLLRGVGRGLGIGGGGGGGEGEGEGEGGGGGGGGNKGADENSNKKNDDDDTVLSDNVGAPRNLAPLPYFGGNPKSTGRPYTLFIY